ncbi:hypothetical protein [Lacisediminihabitans sp. H27-G8]|uniref:hypothetical protein n=1 Tax=Lacisediminihabitans sp. H27-G8 TaxID=3111909 RepID=UPI0038FCC6F7
MESNWRRVTAAKGGLPGGALCQAVDTPFLAAKIRPGRQQSIASCTRERDTL